MRTSLAIFAATAALALGCAGCFSPSTPEDFTSPWQPPKSATPASGVWDELRSRTNGLPARLTLADAADIALRNHPASREAWRTARSAAARVDQIQGLFMPTVEANVGVNRQWLDAGDSEVDQEFLRYGPGLTVNYLIFNFGGGRQAAVEQAMQTVYALNYQYNQSLQDILLEVETGYYTVVSSLATIDAAKANLADLQKTLEAAQATFEAGTGTRVDVLQAQAGADQSLYELAGAEGLYKTALGNLAGAMGLPADTPLEVVLPERNIPQSLEPADVQKILDEALARRPDISALRSSLAASEAAVRVAASPLWPSLYFSGDANRGYYETYVGKEFQDREWSYGGGFSLQWTLFDGMQTVGAKRAAREESEAMRARLEQAELAAGAEIWARYQNYHTALKRYEANAAVMKSATASFEVAQESYKAGLKSLLDILSSQAQLAQARRQDILARQEAFTALARFAHATGLLEKSSVSQPETLFINSTPKELQK